MNDLRMIRPVVLIDEKPYHELNIDGELDLICENAKSREIENYFRMALFTQKHIPCDTYMPPFYSVSRHGSAGCMKGIEIDETLIPNPGGGPPSHAYHDRLQTDEDLEKLHWEPGWYDRAGTMEEFSFVADLIGDIIPVKVTGLFNGMGLGIWDEVSLRRGVAPLLSDLIDRPEFMHKIARKFTDGCVKSIGEAVKYNLIGTNYPLIHCTPAFTNDLAPVSDYDCIKPENTWGRGVAQILGDIFRLQYAKYAISTSTTFSFVAIR